MIHALKVESSTILRFEKNVQIKYKKNEKGGHRNLSDPFEAGFLL